MYNSKVAFSTKKQHHSHMRPGFLNFPLFSMQVKHADNTFSKNNIPLLNPTDILIQQTKQIVIDENS